MPNTSSLAIKVGIFVVVGLIVLVGFSLRASEDALGQKPYSLHAYFADAVGLEEGAEVSLRGVRIGKVRALRFDGKRRLVDAELSIRSDYQLPEDSEAAMERAALLGGTVVVINYGAKATNLRPGGEIQTRKVASLTEMMAVVADVGTEAKDLIKNLNENQEKVVGKIESVIEENREDFRKTSESFAKVGPKLDTLADRLNEVTANMADGKGTLGKLYKDETLYEDLKKFSDDVRAITAEVRDGQGSLHKLVYSDEVATKAEKSFENLGKAGDQVQSLLAEKRGELDSAIASLSGLGPKLDEALADIREITEKVNNGEGTLGKMVNDPSLYDDTRKTVRQVGETFESSEEQGVIRTFFGVIFGAVI
ncbi:MCE family protein [Candidatus Poribacteria bacterium]|nr:MCE family protein [Candidatus Poribacteria bacterium]